MKEGKGGRVIVDVTSFLADTDASHVPECILYPANMGLMSRPGCLPREICSFLESGKCGGAPGKHQHGHAGRGRTGPRRM